MNNWILHIIEKYASKLSIWCWQKELKFYIENEIKNNIMWLNLIGMAVKTGADVYKRKQETKSLQALA